MNGGACGSPHLEPAEPDCCRNLPPEGPETNERGEN